VFSAVGYAEGSIVAITREADVSNATFYTYFRSKEEIFLGVVEELVHEVAAATEDLVRDVPLPVAIAKSNTYFLDSYLAHGRLLRVMSEAANHNEAIRIAVRDIRRAAVKDAARQYGRLQKAGLINPSYRPELLANVLAGAREHAAYLMAFLDPGIDRAELERTLNHVWLSALSPAENPASRST
jgi:AcrR family transcriptional regulator